VGYTDTHVLFITERNNRLYRTRSKTCVSVQPTLASPCLTKVFDRVRYNLLLRSVIVKHGEARVGYTDTHVLFITERNNRLYRTRSNTFVKHGEARVGYTDTHVVSV
jgi:hypothetical protein